MKIYHNPRCSKSRSALAILEANGKAFDVVKYLDEVLSAEEVLTLAAKTGNSLREILRLKEAAWKEAGIEPTALSDEQLAEFVAAHPIVMERPIVEDGERAIVARPPEVLVDWL